MADEARSVEIVQTETDIALARQRVVRSVHALRTELDRRTDWHEWVARRPVAFLGTAFLVGLFIGQGRWNGRS